MLSIQGTSPPRPHLNVLEAYATLRYNTFASAGSDATLSIWDHKVKKRLRQFPKYPAPITALAFNNDNKLAVGVGYAWDEGEEGLRKTGGSVGAGIWIRALGDEVKPKGWTG